MNKTLKNAVADRRSVYAVGKDKVIPDEELFEIISLAVQNAPSAFNSQSARVLVLLGKEHDRLWDFTKEILKGIVPPDKFPPTEKKLNSFQNGYGTILYFEDQDTVTGLQKSYPAYQENFPLWSLQSSGMLQYSLWMLLEEAGYGATLQHYNPLIDEKVKSTWHIPEQWKLIGEMPFGKPLAPPKEKSFLPLDERIKVFK